MKSFRELGINENILKALDEIGYEYPMPVQSEVIPILLNQKTDTIALAQTGTGKTAAFGLPILQNADPNNSNTQVLILSPTRELCIQIAEDLKAYSKYIENLKTLAVYGGASIENQIKQIKKGVQIIVATPGRLIDLLNRKALFINNVNTLILDEADEMLNMGFQEDLEKILVFLPKENRNTLLFSATMPSEIEKIAKQYMNEPMTITVGKRNSGAENIRHVVYMVKQQDKYLTLKRIADYYPDIYGIVFCRTRKETQEIADALIADGYNAEALHGDLSQAQRDYTMQKFRNKHIQLLTATDVAARGIDVNDLTHIINYSIPEDTDVYTHRSGRTGRAGKSGISIAIINQRERNKLRLIENKIGKQFEKELVPNGREVCEKQLFHLINKVQSVEIEHNEIEPYLADIFAKLEGLDRDEIVQRFVSLQFNQFLKYYKLAPDLNVEEPKSKKDKSKGKTDSSDDFGNYEYVSLFINIGKRDGLYPRTLMSLVEEQLGYKGIQFGKIDIFTNHSIFGIPKEEIAKVIDAFEDTYLEDRQIVCRVDEIDAGNFKSSRKGGKKKAKSEAKLSKAPRERRDRKGKAERDARKESRPEKKKSKHSHKKPTRKRKIW